MISTSDLDATVAACDLTAFRQVVRELLDIADGYRECEHIRAMQAFEANPSPSNLRDLLIIAWPLFTMARGIRTNALTRR